MKQLPFGKPMIDDSEMNAVLDVLKGPILVHGPRVKEFEKRFAAFAGAPFAASVSSCTAALHLVYFDMGLGAGDEVIVPAQTHNATAHAVEYTGATPIFVDAEMETGNIDIDQIEAAITERTRAISVVHYLGMPVDMDRVNAIAQKHDLLVVEDCALAIGSYYKNKHMGLHGDAGCFSFYPVKHMTTAEGGMLITKRQGLYDRIVKKRAFGVTKNHGERKIPGIYDVEELGYNYRMSEVHSAIGIEQVKKLGSFLKAREANYKALHQCLQGIGEVDLFQAFKPDYQSSFYCLSVILNEKIASDRYAIVQALNAKGIGTSIYYPQPVPCFSYYKEKYGYPENGRFPVAEIISNRSIAFPVGPHLTTEDMQYIGKELKNVLVKVK